MIKVNVWKNKNDIKSKRIWSGELSFLPRESDTIFINGYGETIKYVYLDLNKNEVEIKLNGLDRDEFYPEVEDMHE